MVIAMKRFVLPVAALGALATAVQAQPMTSPSAAPAETAPATPSRPGAPVPSRPGPPANPAPATLPAVGDALAITGTAAWPRLDWLYDVPAPNDAAGKVGIHWFCAPRVPACTDDLARIVTIKENGRAYVIAYINGSRAQARKLDPIRESEGVGRGTVAFGRGATRLMKQLGITGPASIVVDVDGKVVHATTSGAPADLDARDAKVAAAIGAIKEYVASSEGPTQAKPGEKFALSMSVKLASWLGYSTKSPTQLTVTVPPDFKCDATTLTGDQIKLVDKQLTATVTCSGPRGIYEARGELRFGYDAPGGATGIGAESAKWKFEIKN
jgi:hypothetical protein